MQCIHWVVSVSCDFLGHKEASTTGGHDLSNKVAEVGRPMVGSVPSQQSPGTCCSALHLPSPHSLCLLWLQALHIHTTRSRQDWGRIPITCPSSVNEINYLLPTVGAQWAGAGALLARTGGKARFTPNQFQQRERRTSTDVLLPGRIPWECACYQQETEQHTFSSMTIIQCGRQT